jgi:hypothetical protein
MPSDPEPAGQSRRRGLPKASTALHPTLPDPRPRDGTSQEAAPELGRFSKICFPFTPLRRLWSNGTPLRRSKRSIAYSSDQVSPQGWNHFDVVPGNSEYLACVGVEETSVRAARADRGSPVVSPFELGSRAFVQCDRGPELPGAEVLRRAGQAFPRTEIRPEPGQITHRGRFVRSGCDWHLIVFRWLHGLTRKAKARDPRIYYMVKRSAQSS